MLNKSNGNMYEFITDTWNPLAGKCPHNCGYCSTNKFRYPVLKKKYSGPIRIEESELKTNLGKGKFIFVCAQNDLFADDVPVELIKRILEYCSKFDNQYLFQTKNPFKLFHYQKLLPNKSVVCTTIETNRIYPPMEDCPPPEERATMTALIDMPKYLTIEPIMDFDLEEMVKLITDVNPIQINIGADSGRNKLPEPSKEKILQLIERIHGFTVVQKINLKRLLK